MTTDICKYMDKLITGEKQKKIKLILELKNIFRSTTRS